MDIALKPELESFVTETLLVALAATPGMGSARPELGESLRSFPVGNYLVFHRERSDGIELLRLLHRARNLRRALKR